jgi:SAM-dependent methyltransferase
MNFTGERWIPGEVDPRIEADHLQRYVFALKYSAGMRILDIACGAGGGSHLLATRGSARYVEGVDISAESVAHARDHYAEANLCYHVGDIESYSPNELFDLITCFETIEHVPNDRLVLMNLRSWLSLNGTLLISSPNRPITSPTADSIDDRPTNSFHVREFTPTELSDRLRDAGFSHVKLYGQRLRYHSRFGRIVKWLNACRDFIGWNPDNDTSPAVRPFWLRTPRYFVLEARP